MTAAGEDLQHEFVGSGRQCERCGGGMWADAHYGPPPEELVLEPTREPQRPHTLHLDLDAEGYPSWRPGPCPYGGTGDNRPCLLVEEASGCPWEAYDNGGHHLDACRPSYAECDAAYLASPDDGSRPACWESAVPDECNGVYHPEFGHAHPIDGCGFAEAFGWDGMGATVMFAEDVTDAPFPMQVDVRWDHEGAAMVVTPRRNPNWVEVTTLDDDGPRFVPVAYPVDPRTGRVLR